MSEALTLDKELTLKIENQIEDLRRYKDSVHLGALLVIVEQMLGSGHLLVAIVRSVLNYDMSGVIGVSAKFFSEGVKDTLTGISDARTVVAGVASNVSANPGAATATAAGLAVGCTAAAVCNSAPTVSSSANQALARTAGKAAARESLK